MKRANYIAAFIISLLAASALLSTGCASMKPVTSDGIRNDMAAISREIASDRSAMNTLGGRRVGKTGFYYVLDSNGRVMFHPRQALIGSSFNRVWFVNQVLAEKSGCVTYTLGNRIHYLFFTPIDDEEILCFSIVSDDLPQPGECKPAQVKSAD